MLHMILMYKAQNEYVGLCNYEDGFVCLCVHMYEPNLRS